MEQEKQIPSSEEEGHCLSDTNWIWSSLDSLSKLSAILFHNYGRGAILINKENILQPPRYILESEIRENETYSQKMKNSIELYNPNTSFIVSFDQDEEGMNKNYQVEVFPKNDRFMRTSSYQIFEGSVSPTPKRRQIRMVGHICPLQ